MDTTLNAANAFHDEHEHRRRTLFWKRIAAALALVLIAHLFFVFVVTPLMKFSLSATRPTEITEITPEELAKMKKQILKSNLNVPLMNDDLHPELKTKERPKDAKFIAPFNQTVKEEQVVGLQKETARLSGDGAQKTQEKREKIELSKLGLGSKIEPPTPQTEQTEMKQGQRGPSVPESHDTKHFKKGLNNMLNAVESQYYSFFARFREPLERNWYFNLSTKEEGLMAAIQRARFRGDELVTWLTITFDRSGTILSVNTVEPSGVPYYDNLCLQAAQKLGSLPNPPPDLFEGKETYTHPFGFALHGMSDVPTINVSQGD